MSVVSVATVLVSSMLKFLLSPLVSFGFDHTYWQTLLLVAAGGCGWTFVFHRMSSRMLGWLRRRTLKLRAQRIAQGLEPRRVFTRTNRRIVRAKQSYGLLTLAVAPPILSIPITAVLAAKYFHHDHRTLPVLFASVCAWSIILTTAWGAFR